jgi:hypothetical protein
VAEQFVVPADAVALVNSHYHTKFHISKRKLLFFKPPYGDFLFLTSITVNFN